MLISNKKKQGLVIILSFGLVILTAMICLGIGRYSIPLSEVVEVIFSWLFGSGETGTAGTVIFKVRLPRVLLAIAAGAGLACSGAAFQGLFSNPLATPDTLGVASGASFGAVLAMMLGGNLIVIQLFALASGLVACGITYWISRVKSQRSVIMIVLSGMVVSALFQAFVSLLKYLADPEDQLPSITYWLLGSMSSVTYTNLMFGLPCIVLGATIIFVLRWRLNILSLTEDEARSMEVNIRVLRLLVIVASSLITASVVSMCGLVGWVGLLVPHIARMLMGSNNNSVIPLSLSLGAIFMLIIDTAARSATAAEIPISILTAIIGAPFFIGLLRKTGGVWS